MAKHVTRVLVGLLIILFQATVNRGSVVFCISAECLGYNAVGIAIWFVGLWLVFSGIRRALHEKKAKPPETTPT
jgi:hypothetical protein